MSVTTRIMSIAITSAIALASLTSACQTAMSAPSGAAASSAHVHGMAVDRPAVHGMLLVGTNALYVSHLPMFHAPHDYQALAEVALQDGAGDARARYVADKAARTARSTRSSRPRRADGHDAARQPLCRRPLSGPF